MNETVILWSRIALSIIVVGFICYYGAKERCKEKSKNI